METFKNKNLSNCLRKYRMVRGLKQKDVAKILGLKNSNIISRWEKGVCMPSPMYLFKLAALYRTLVDALFIDLVRMLRKELLEKEAKIQKRK